MKDPAGLLFSAASQSCVLGQFLLSGEGLHKDKSPVGPLPFLHWSLIQHSIKEGVLLKKVFRNLM
ncbi:hypothetical protein [Geotalea toluenoxydans]|uniref:hypothetical protein n=1 Tax=Geotalea toluenoxydans TaxID=421624 RepID=UPI000AD9E1F3|nr:hypothetical protein [Geotalea toluenoxydans]